jgi:hypothetical protein
MISRPRSPRCRDWLARCGFGGVYLWENHEAMKQFTQTDLFKAVATHPNLTDVVSRDFDVLEAPTRVTRGLIPIEA